MEKFSTPKKKAPKRKIWNVLMIAPKPAPPAW